MKEATPMLQGLCIGLALGTLLTVGMLELDGYESHHTLIERGVMMHHPTTGKVIWTEEPES